MMYLESSCHYNLSWYFLNLWKNENFKKCKFWLFRNSNSNLTTYIFLASLWTVCTDYLPAQCCRASLVFLFFSQAEYNILHSTLFPCFLKAEWNWNKRGYLAPWYMIFFTVIILAKIFLIDANIYFLYVLVKHVLGK